MIEYCIFKSPLGKLTLGIYQKKLCFLSFRGITGLKTWANQQGVSFKKTKTCPPLLKRELTKYFQKKLKRFQAPLVFLSGTPFEQQVWKTLQTIPYGETRSYQWIADSIKNSKAVRAVGQANGKNFIPLVIPCHRVISSDGGLGGYSGGPDLKRKLLELEGVF